MKKFKFLDTPGPFSGIEYRRTTRVERAVPLVISGQNNHGQPFQERTWTISFNLHGRVRYFPDQLFKVESAKYDPVQEGDGPMVKAKVTLALKKRESARDDR